MASPTGQTGQARYPKQLVILISDGLNDRIESDAERHRLSKSEVARTYLEAGIDAGETAASADARVGS